MKRCSRKWLFVIDVSRFADEIDCLHIALKHIVRNGFYAFVCSVSLIFVYVECNSGIWLSLLEDMFSIRTYASVKGSREQMIDYLHSKAEQCGGTYYTSRDRWCCHEC